MAENSITSERQRQDAIERLTANEQLDYERYCKRGGPRLSPEISKTLFDLYVHGFTMDDIHGLNPLFEPGMLVQAKVEHLWDARKDAYVAEVLAEVPQRLRLTAAEAINFMSLQLSVAHKVSGEKLKRYLMTGDPKALEGGFSIESFKTYKSCIESLAKLLEASTPKRDGAPSPFQPTPGQGDGGPQDPDGAGVGNRFTPAEADAIRARLEQRRG